MHRPTDGGRHDDPASIQSEDPTEEYRIALTGMLIHGLRTVFVGLKRGEYKLQNSSVLPISSEMPAMANLECRSLREERMRLGIKAGRENAALGGPCRSRYGLKDVRITQEKRRVRRPGLRRRRRMPIARRVRQRLQGEAGPTGGASLCCISIPPPRHQPITSSPSASTSCARSPT